MTTRFYLPQSAASVPFSKAVDTDWEDAAGVARAALSTSKIADAMATVTLASDGDATSKDFALRQYVSGHLTVGQTITGAQAIKAQTRIQAGLLNRMRTTYGLRVTHGLYQIHKTVLAVTRDNTDAPGLGLTNRQFTANSAATDYTTRKGDRLLLEVGVGGDPDAGFDHACFLRLGDAAASDLPEDDTDTTDVNPWFQLTDSLTFTTYTTTGDYHVSAEANNGAWNSGGTFATEDPIGHKFGHDGLDTYKAFFRFTGLTIPAGSTITACTINFLAAATLSATTCNVKIQAIAADSATAPVDAADGNGRSLTTANVTWSPGSQTADTEYSTPDLSAVLQEVVNRGGWASGNNVVFYLQDNSSSSGAYRQADGYTVVPAGLSVTYTAPSGSTGRSLLMMMGVG